MAEYWSRSQRNSKHTIEDSNFASITPIGEPDETTSSPLILAVWKHVV